MSTLLKLLWEPTLQTLLMVGVSALLSGIGGLGLGVALVVTEHRRVLSAPWLFRFLNAITNVGRSIPFIILLVAILPFTRFLVWTAIGTAAAIVPLVIGAIPYVGRLVQGALHEVDPGVIEAVIAMGATPSQVIRRVYLPEALPALIRAMTVVTITLVSYSAMAGAIGGGGLGDLAIRYGYQGFRLDVMIATVVELVLLIQLVQFVGDHLANHFQHRNTTAASKKSSRSKIIAVVAIAASVLVLVCIAYRRHNAIANPPKVLRIGVNPLPHGEILEAALPLLKQQGVLVQIVYFSDYVQPNLALVSGDLDANYFQHVPFMESFNSSKGTHVLSAGAVHIEPLGIYAGRSKSLKDLKDGAIITMPNDPANSGRALFLLQDADLIKLGTGKAVNTTVQDIEQNPHHLRFRELEAAQLPRSLDDADLAVINMNYALVAKLDPLKDALKLESGSSPYANIVSVMPDHAADPRIQTLVRVLQSAEMQRFIRDKYHGAVLPAE